MYLSQRWNDDDSQPKHIGLTYIHLCVDFFPLNSIEIHNFISTVLNIRALQLYTRCFWIIHSIAIYCLLRNYFLPSMLLWPYNKYAFLMIHNYHVRTRIRSRSMLLLLLRKVDDEVKCESKNVILIEISAPPHIAARWTLPYIYLLLYLCVIVYIEIIIIIIIPHGTHGLCCCWCLHWRLDQKIVHKRESMKKECAMFLLLFVLVISVQINIGELP